MTKRKINLDTVGERKKRRRRAKESPSRFPKCLSTGSTMLNIACMGSPDGGYIPGRYYLLVGDSSAGKTWLMMTAFAEAVRSGHFSNYRLIYDDVEKGNNIDLPAYFGQKTADAIEPPDLDDETGEPKPSRTVEQFYDNLHNILDQAEEEESPVFYVLDSMDSLTSEAETDKVDESRKAREKGKEITGSYGDGKAKVNSQRLRTYVNRLDRTGSVLVIVSQTRDNLGFTGGKSRSGGHAVKFYATLEIWLSRIKTLKRQVLGKPRPYGIRVKAQVKKNRLEGQEEAAEFEIINGYGLDDAGSCVDYLLDEGVWKKAGKKIDTDGFCGLQSVDALLKEMDLNADKYSELKKLCTRRHKEIRERLKPDRPRRYE